MAAKAQILLVEDDNNFGSVLKAYLELNNYSVSWIENGKDAIDQFNQLNPDLCVLDIMLPGSDGYTVAEYIRKANKRTPFIFLTAKTLKEDILKGYARGADDYITKPFDSEVLVCKIDAILARAGSAVDELQIENPVQIGEFSFDHELRTIVRKNESKKLSPKESELLKLLCINKNRVLARDHALQQIWGEDSYFTTRSMDVYITKLRKYLKHDPSLEIINIHGNGFRLIVNDQ